MIKNIEAIVVAGGLGLRLNSKLPKALMPLKGRALLAYSLEVFDAHPAIGGIIVVGVKDYLNDFERIARRFKKVRALVAGGRKRSDSVKCGLKALCVDTKIVLVHDAARPFVDSAMIDRLIISLKKNKAAIVGVPVKFTVKRVEKRTLNIQETPPQRSIMGSADAAGVP